MATTPNYGWVTPAPTDFVTDLPADFETFADAVDDTLHDLNPETTEGDLAYLSATADVKTRLGIGTAGQVLKVNSGATAPEWGSVTTSSPNWDLLNAGGTALTGAATITISGITGQKAIMVLVEGASSANASSNFSVRFNGDSGSNYTQFGGGYKTGDTYNKDNFGLKKQSYSTSTGVQLAFGGNSHLCQVSGAVTLFNADSSGWKNYLAIGSADTTGASVNQESYTTQGIYEATGEITSVSIVLSSGNFDNGTIYVLGAS
jgi:hypothetical protein